MAVKVRRSKRLGQANGRALVPHFTVDPAATSAKTSTLNRDSCHRGRMSKIIYATRATAVVVLFGFLVQDGAAGMLSKDAMSGDLVCTDQSARDYQRIQLLAGRMTIGPDLPGTPEQHRVIHENFSKLSFEDGKTYFIVAHKPTGELFTSDCAAETCSFEEVSEPIAQCQMMDYRNGNMHSDACMFLAVRFRDENFCLQQPMAAQ